MQGCHDARGRPVAPIVWSRRNGPWRRVEVLWIGAAPGNAGGRGSGHLGAHGTRIPFGGDLAGANLEVLLGSIGLDRNDTFIAAAFNRLPARGGGEPSAAEIRAPVGDHESSIALLRDTIVAAGPRLVVALGIVALRTLAGALTDGVSIPGLRSLEAAGFVRGRHASSTRLGVDSIQAEWQAAWGADPLPDLLWLTHPSGQNMSPFAGRETLFHRRMRAARTDLRRAARSVLARPLPARRPPVPDTGIYALPEWRRDVAPRHERLDRLWRAHGL